MVKFKLDALANPQISTQDLPVNEDGTLNYRIDGIEIYLKAYNAILKAFTEQFPITE